MMLFAGFKKALRISASIFSFFFFLVSCLMSHILLQVAKEQADVIVMDDDFATIVKVAKWGRAVYINIQKFVQFQLTVNIVALMINFVSACITGAFFIPHMFKWVGWVMGQNGLRLKGVILSRTTQVGSQTCFSIF